MCPTEVRPGSQSFVCYFIFVACVCENSICNGESWMPVTYFRKPFKIERSVKVEKSQKSLYKTEKTLLLHSHSHIFQTHVSLLSLSCSLFQSTSTTAAQTLWGTDYVCGGQTGRGRTGRRMWREQESPVRLQ